jgi:hypothetical protein
MLGVKVSINLEPIKKLVQIFPDLRGRLLALIGSKARRALKENYLSGQELTLRAFPKDKRGRYTITSNVNKSRNQVVIYSYPVNLFEFGRKLRSGEMELGKNIITGKLKAFVMSNIGTYVKEFEDEILKPEIKAVGL